MRKLDTPMIVKCECAAGSKNLEGGTSLPHLSSKDLEDGRTARGHVAVAFLTLAGTIAALLVLCVVLALT
jgi:hypothetical protein